GDPGEPGHRFCMHRPDGVLYGRVVRVVQPDAAVGMAGQVELRDPIGGDAGQVVARIESVVAGADIDVVDVEQDAAVGALGDPGEEFPLGHRRATEGDVAGDVFEHDLPAQHLLDLLHAAHHVRERLLP